MSFRFGVFLLFEGREGASAGQDMTILIHVYVLVSVLFPFDNS